MTTAAAPPVPGPRPRSRLAALVPAGLRDRLRPAAGLPWRERAVFLARWLSGAAARRSSGPHPVRRVLFVCHGNIIRSALAEVLCRREAAAQGTVLEVASAGLHARPGRPADPRADEAAAALGVSLAGHAARPVTADAVRAADLILAMDYTNDAELAARFPSAWGKIRLLGAFADADPVIPDPYVRDARAVREAGARIADAVRGLLRHLRRVTVTATEGPR